MDREGRERSEFSPRGLGGVGRPSRKGRVQLGGSLGGLGSVEWGSRKWAGSGRGPFQ